MKIGRGFVFEKIETEIKKGLELNTTLSLYCIWGG